MTQLQDNDLIASFYPATKRVPAHLSVSAYDADTRKFRSVTEIRVDDKRDARECAAKMNAKPWNF